ncbi:MAG: hypothetical protein ACTSUO_03400 [Candidatus Thorarchaeota archaeon]
MAITLALARDRATGNTRPLYFGEGKRIKGMARIWKSATGKYSDSVKSGCPDATFLLKAENNVRRNYTRILLKTSVKYGNTETKRVKREEGNKKYLNILWDYSGGRLRDVVKARFSFPKPVQYRKKNGKLGYCYYGSATIPFYPVMHNHIPELDFGDMIRSPLMELARQCLKYGVSIKEAKFCIDALLWKLIPFLDYVYSGRRSGKSNYVRDGIKELRKVIDLIKRDYGTRNGQRQSITSEIFVSEEAGSDPKNDMTSEEVMEKDSIELDEEPRKPYKKQDDMHFLEKVIDNVEQEGVVFGESFQELKALLENGILTIEDSNVLLEQAKEQSRRIGTRIHRFIARNFQSPFSFNGVIFHGKDMAYDNSGFMLLSEIPIDSGRGRVDFLLVRAKKLTKIDGAPTRIICEPIMVVDLKSKSAFDFDVYGIKSRSKESNNTVREFILGHRTQTDKEWEMILANTPRKDERLQLDAYEQALLTDYRNVMRKDPDAQESLAKGVIVVDSFQDWADVSKSILSLVLRAYDGCINGTLAEGDYIVPTKDEKRRRIALRMLSVITPTRDAVELDLPIPQKPLRKQLSKVPEDKKEFILYLTIPGRGSPAQSAAMIAEKWHGLEYVYGLSKHQHRDVLWIDLVGEFKDPILRRNQFRLNYQTVPIKRFFKDRMQVQDLSDLIESYIYEGLNVGTFRKSIQDILRNARNPFIVVSGWEILRRSIPTSYKKYLQDIAAIIIQSRPQRSTTLWFARPVPLAQNNITYSTRCVAPYYQGAIWQNFTDTIIWNVAISNNYHERVIFKESLDSSLESKSIEIEPLMGWGEDFRPGGRKEELVYQKGINLTSTRSRGYLKKRIDKAKTLIPHLLEKHKYSQRPRSDNMLDFDHIPAEDYPPQGLEPLLSFNPLQIYSQVTVDDSGVQIDVDGTDIPKKSDGRFKLLLPIDTIDRQRKSKPMELNVTPPKRNTRPPSEHYLTPEKFDEIKIALAEIRQLRKTINIIRTNEEGHLTELLERLSEVLLNVTVKGDVDDVDTLYNILRHIHTILETNELSKEIWKRMLPFRSRIPPNLTEAQKEHVTSIQKNHPDILKIVGNHLFLMILAALVRTPTVPFTETLYVLWDQIQPWHLIGLGFKPEYPKSHTRGRSVLDRHKLLKRLEQLAIERYNVLEQQPSLTNVRYGQLLGWFHSEGSTSKYLWLIFQRASGIYDMNAALLNPRGIDPTLSIHETLNDMVSERTYWSESDLDLLSRYAKLQGNECMIPVMIANQQGLQVLWIEDGEYNRWKPVGHLEYSTRKFEDVTLIRTISLTANPHLKPVEYNDLRRPIHSIENLVETAFFILNKALGDCIHAKCRVSLDEDERIYRVSFTGQKSGLSLGELLIKRTADLLEILRRPDNECEPVIVNGKRLIWNRFRNISYDDNIALIIPWVNRYEPFSGMSLKLPPSARELLDARKEYDVTLELYHDPWTCPLRDISLEAIDKAKQQTRQFGHLHMFRHETHWAEPDRISNEPGAHHGSCWRIHVDTPHKLTVGLNELMDVRLTDAQARALLGHQELVFQDPSAKEWVIHTFRVMIQEKHVEEAKESYHIQKLLEGLTGVRYGSRVSTLYRAAPGKWSPYITLHSEYIVVGLRNKENRDVTMEKKIHEHNVTLRERTEVFELLTYEMDQFLESKGISSDRRLKAAIRTEIKDILDDAGVTEDKAQVEFDTALILPNSVGGRVLYVFLKSESASPKIAVTPHLHDVKEKGRISVDDFVSEVESILSEYNLSDDAMEKAVTECLAVMRGKKLIRR